MIKTLTLTLGLTGFAFEVTAQEWKFYTKEMSYDREERKVTEPFLIDLDLSTHVLIKIAPESYFRAELSQEKIAYSGWGTSSHVIIWENVDVNGEKQKLVYYSDMSSGKTDFCMLSESSEICFLNIKKFE